MKKVAMTLTAASLIMGSLAGCGVDNQAGDMGANNFRQAGWNQGEGMTTEQMTRADNYTGNWTGEGPITDMMTPERRGRGGNGGGMTTRNQGRTTGIGVNQRPGVPFAGGIANQRSTGTGTDAEGNVGMTGQRHGIGAADFDRRGTGGNVGTLTNQRHPGATRQGAGITGQRRAGAPGLTGSQRGTGAGKAGMTGQHGSSAGKAGMTGQRGAGAGGAGLTGEHPGMVNDRGILSNQNRANNGTNDSNYHKDYDGQTVQRISDRISKLGQADDSRVIVHDNTVIVGVEADQKNKEKTEQQIRQTINQMNGDYDVHVVTDRDRVSRIRTMDDQLRGGTAFDEVGATFRGMMNDLGRAAQRPFERSR